MLENVVILDLETTGLDPEKDEIIEIGAIKIKNSVKTEYQQLINPRRFYISSFIFNLCEGLTEEELRNSPGIEEIEDEFLSFIEDLPIICHNASFDSSFLINEFGSGITNIFLDSLELFAIFKPHFPGHSISYLSRHYNMPENGKKHRALDDSRETLYVMEKLFEELSDTDNELLQKTFEYLEGFHNWHWLYFLRRIPYKLKTEKIVLKDKTKKEEKIKCDYSTNDIKKILSKKDIFEKEFQSYKYKEHQLILANNIIEAFSRSAALFAEAPTGSGKTLAYLIVALLWAVENKEKIYISTNTKNLQQQIDNDLPRLCRVLGIEGLKHIEMKGINNYACKNKILKAMEESPNDFDEKLARIFLYNWTKRSENGEIDTISYWFRQKNKKLNPLLKVIGCYREDCMGSQCNYEGGCFYRKKVEELEKSLICTINHSLLLTWPFSYPPINKLIIDEAHSLEDNCYSGFTEEVKSPDIKGLLYQFHRNRTDGYLHYLHFRYKQLNPGSDFRMVYEYVSDLRNYIDRISMELEIISRENDSGYPFREEISSDWHELKTLMLGCAKIMENIALFVDNVLEDAVLKEEGFKDTIIFRQGGSYIKAFHAWSGILANCTKEDDESNCLYVDYHRERWTFRITPIDISEHFQQKVLSKLDTVILTSATLSENQSYERLADNLGFSSLKSMEINYLEPLNHVFDYEKNSVLAIPSDALSYQDDEFINYAADAIYKVCSVMGGRTLVLFSNLQRLRQVVDRVGVRLEKIGVSPYDTTGGSRQTLVDMFREDKNAVLFGSKALFEGVDIKGPGLSCVIIDKLPYPYPGDPLYNARSRYLALRDRSPFRELSLSVAIRTFRQQFGRLIRSEDDKGFVMILSQLNKDRNKKRIIRELPPARVISEPLEMIIEEIKEQFNLWGYNETN